MAQKAALLSLSVCTYRVWLVGEGEYSSSELKLLLQFILPPTTSHYIDGAHPGEALHTPSEELPHDSEGGLTTSACVKSTRRI